MSFVKKMAALLAAILLLITVSCVMDGAKSDDDKGTSSSESDSTQTCAAPTISGTTSFTDSTTVMITTSTAGAEIYYPTNNSAPTTSSTKYTATITLTETTTVKAIAVKSGYNNSTVSSKTFTKNVIVSENDSGVMLQGFTWSSAPRDDSTQQGKWYKIVTARANDIKNTFEYMWCPPPSDSNGDSPEGYAPKMLNILSNAYGTESEQKAMINAIKPTKAIADIVINHRAGTTNWADFTNPSWTDDYYSICSDDECFSNSNSPIKGNTKCGAADTGEGYGSFRDIDHTNTAVQNGIVTWMNDVLKAAGYVGWRYDFVKGYDAKYVGLYNKRTSAAFSVGEHWPTDGYNASNPAAWGKQFKTWISRTEAESGQRSRLFDFTLKGALNTVFGYTSVSSGTTNGNGNYKLLANDANLCISQPADAVTFVDNHDTGSTQGHWALKQDAIGAAYAMILTHPGYPCVSWNHYFTFAESGSISVTQNGIKSDDTFIGGTTVAGTSNTMRQHIDKLITLRKSLGIAYNSSRRTLQADSTCYAAQVYGANGSLIVSIGGNYTGNTTDYEEYYSGTNFKIWTQENKCAAPVITISGGTVSISCGTSGSSVYYTIDGSNPTSSSAKYTTSFTVNVGTTVKAIAIADGLNNSSVASMTYSGKITLTVTVPDWVWNDNAAIFA